MDDRSKDGNKAHEEWDKMYNMMREYKQINEHCIASSYGQNGCSLASWVRIERSLCHNLADKRKCMQDGLLDLNRLGSEKAKLVKLNGLGFEWDQQW